MRKKIISVVLMCFILVSSIVSANNDGWNDNNNDDCCKNVVCPVNYQCKADNGKASCVANQEKPCTCEGVNCGDDKHCEIRGNKAICIDYERPTKDPKDCDACEKLHCPRGNHCIPRPPGGWSREHRNKHWQLHPEHCGHYPNRVKAICVPSPKGDCSTTKCPIGFKCRLQADGPHCVKKEKPHCITCAEMHCEQNGLVCVLVPQNTKRNRFNEPDCCPIVPTCIDPTTISGSTIATSTGVTRHGTTIASVATTTGGWGRSGNDRDNDGGWGN